MTCFIKVFIFDRFFSILCLLHIFALKHSIRRFFLKCHHIITLTACLEVYWRGGKGRMKSEEYFLYNSYPTKSSELLFDRLRYEQQGGATSAGMTFQLIHIFLLKIFMIQNKVILSIFLSLTIFPCICT